MHTHTFETYCFESKILPWTTDFSLERERERVREIAREKERGINTDSVI